MPPTRGNRRTLAATVGAAGISQLPTAAIVVALASIHHEFGTSLEALQWTVTAFLIPYTALMIVAGRVADVFGRRLILLAGTGAFVGGSALAALSVGAPMLIGSIAVAGAGAAAMIPSSMSVITDVFFDAQRAVAIGLWGGATELVSGVGILIGGLLTELVGWRAIFLVCILIGVAILATVVLATPESRDPHASRHIDYLGAAVSVFLLSALSLALIQGPSWGFGAPSTIALFALAAAAAVVFVVVELRVPFPIIDFSLLRRRNFAGSLVVIFALDFSLGALLFFLPLFFQQMVGYSAIFTGIVLLPLTGLMVLGSPLGGKIAAKVGPRPPIVVGLGLMSIGIFLMTRMTTETTVAQLWLPTAIIGFGTGLALTPMNLAAMNAVNPERAGAASGLLVTLSGLGATMGVALTGALFNELQANRVVTLLAGMDTTVTEAQARNLTGLLADTSRARAELDQTVGVGESEAVEVVREAFVSALNSSLFISVALVGVSVLLTVLVMRKEPAAPEDLGPPIGAPPFRPAQ
ncbi:MFS transporter [Hoyosella altamirensis]|uniref:EmrB/QacA subfamily drug resistance transporter n=1 Tax=Hoyosella altamirensis TaxID=616997 RepID=A0A839RLF2_9ACTN|nr:MFS transporter [Hoyosella altamirensis]MBB3036984.1 EmrB/QacA subfamily drug resistance transporter [Hoyosella altamirensis]